MACFASDFYLINLRAERKCGATELPKQRQLGCAAVVDSWGGGLVSVDMQLVRGNLGDHG